MLFTIVSEYLNKLHIYNDETISSANCSITPQSPQLEILFFHQWDYLPLASPTSRDFLINITAHQKQELNHFINTARLHWESFCDFSMCIGKQPEHPPSNHMCRLLDVDPPSSALHPIECMYHLDPLEWRWSCFNHSAPHPCIPTLAIPVFPHFYFPPSIMAQDTTNPPTDLSWDTYYLSHVSPQLQYHYTNCIQNHCHAHNAHSPSGPKPTMQHSSPLPHCLCILMKKFGLAHCNLPQDKHSYYKMMMDKLAGKEYICNVVETSQICSFCDVSLCHICFDESHCCQ